MMPAVPAVAGWHLPVVAAVVVTAGAAAARLGVETAARLPEQRRLRSAFAGSVSPQIMQAILAGNADSGLGGRRFRICVLFADIRSFTTRSESMPPEALIALLNRYFQEVTAAIHRHEGTVDKFIGDVVNVASRLEGVTKAVGYRIVASREVVADLVDKSGFVDLGAQPIKGHAPVDVYGWGEIPRPSEHASVRGETVK